MKKTNEPNAGNAAYLLNPYSTEIGSKCPCCQADLAVTGCEGKDHVVCQCCSAHLVLRNRHFSMDKGPIHRNDTAEKSGKKKFYGFLACPYCGRGDQYSGLEDGSPVACKRCGKMSMLSGLCLVEFKEDKMPVVTPGDIEPVPLSGLDLCPRDPESKTIGDIQQEQKQFTELYEHLFGLNKAEALSGGNLCPACSHKNDVDGYISGDSKTCEGCGANLDFKEGDLTSRDYIPGSIINTEKEKIQALVDAHWNYKQKDLTIGADRNRVYTFDEVMEIRKWDYTSSAVHFYKHGFDAAKIVIDQNI